MVLQRQLMKSKPIKGMEKQENRREERKQMYLLKIF